MAERIISKTCRVCKQTKPIEQFYKRPDSPNGYRNDCKVCCYEKMKKYYKTDKGKEAVRCGQKKYRKTEKCKANSNRFRQSEKNKLWWKHYIHSERGKAVLKKAAKRYRQSEKGKAQRLNSAQQYNIRHPERVAAHIAVREAIRKGQLPQPDSLRCHYCPAQAEQYHHWHGYAPEHWLDVVPVCQKCHNNLK